MKTWAKLFRGSIHSYTACFSARVGCLSQDYADYIDFKDLNILDFK